jgi:hypothetical protein
LTKPASSMYALGAREPSTRGVATYASKSTPLTFYTAVSKTA